MPQTQAPSPIVNLLPLILIFVIFYFLLIRPRRQRGLFCKMNDTQRERSSVNCPKCCKENISSSKFCLACGSPLPVEAKSQTAPKVDINSEEKCLGIKSNVAAALSYFLGFFTGVIFYLASKGNKFVRFNAVQSICLSIGAIVIGAVFSGVPTLATILNIGIFILWIVLMIRAGQGKYLRLPLIGNFAKKQS